MNENLKLHNLRTELEIINFEFFELIDKRQAIVNQIQALKKESKETSNWNPIREKELFEKYHASNNSDKKLDLMYSLLIEKQAHEIGRYPEWSNGEHLNISERKLASFINPILLFIRNKEEYRDLDLKEEYNNIVEEIFKNES